MNFYSVFIQEFLGTVLAMCLLYLFFRSVVALLGFAESRVQAWIGSREGGETLEVWRDASQYDTLQGYYLESIRRRKYREE